MEVLGFFQEPQALTHRVLGVCGFTSTVLSVSKHPMVLVWLRHEFTVVIEKQVLPLIQRLLVGHLATP